MTIAAVVGAGLDCELQFAFGLARRAPSLARPAPSLARQAATIPCRPCTSPPANSRHLPRTLRDAYMFAHGTINAVAATLFKIAGQVRAEAPYAEFGHGMIDSIRLPTEAARLRQGFLPPKYAHHKDASWKSRNIA